MPCWARVQIRLEDVNTLRAAARELGLQVSDVRRNTIAIADVGTYNVLTKVLTASSEVMAGRLKQRYGIIQAERTARLKGMRTLRKAQQDGSLLLQVQYR